MSVRYTKTYITIYSTVFLFFTRLYFERFSGAGADRVHWLGEPSQIFIETTLFLVLRLIITV